MKQIKILFVGVLALCLALSLCACGGTESSSSDAQSNNTESSIDSESKTQSTVESENQSQPEAKAAFTVTVVDENGNSVQGVVVQVCQGETCLPCPTGEDGVAVFNVEITENYKLSVAQCPDGYVYEGGDIPLESGATEYTLEIATASAE